MSGDDEQQPILQATVQPLARVGEGCLSRFDPDALNDQQGADFSAAEQFRQQLLVEHNPVLSKS
ncbi:hypothetical protein FXF61_04475 [Pseudomonas sp. C27(2019)]|uniref:hypothetical protein n=1 Tax=Pseudomonas sp. C27(2019) TaxID=2604941 RepID=UPI00124859F4|nr:hypothetical protein [Pseudomonas sp. C27(2019)]QEY58462.1 hypothetical protein FXF61_04475 [Pseudomonas sp. C27(2019)]